MLSAPFWAATEQYLRCVSLNPTSLAVTGITGVSKAETKRQLADLLRLRRTKRLLSYFTLPYVYVAISIFI